MVSGVGAAKPGLAPVTWIGEAANGRRAVVDSTGPEARVESGAEHPSGVPSTSGSASEPHPDLSAEKRGAALLAADDEVRTASAAEAAAEKRARRAENVSMHALTRRGQSRRELESLLERRELDADDIEAELLRLEGVGLIDDAALAETIVRTHHDRKGLGRSALVAELRRRQIGAEHIEVATEQIDGDDELDRARALAEKRATQVRSLDRETAHRRLSGFLMRKGYSGSIVRTVVDEVLAGNRSEPGTVRFR
ncbi:MAG: hypothetical protein RI885_2038 [Actinomycetota bacterium]|jgi:regulatory protein